jgi:hypothetical protein
MPGKGKDQWRIHVVLHVAPLAPRVVFAAFPAVVAPENDDRIGAQAEVKGRLIVTPFMVPPTPDLSK